MCSSRRRRRCVVCLHGFLPNPRVGDRQRVCGKAECRQKHRRDVQADWRQRHPGYFIEWRARERAALSSSEPVEPPALAAPLSQLPWALAQEEFGVAGADFLGSMGRLLVKHAKDEMRGQVRGAIEEFPQVGPASAKDEIRG